MPPAAAVLDARLVADLLDDAALFPPGEAPMPAAVPSHVAHGRAWYADLVGPFVCPASRLDEHAAVLSRQHPGGPLVDVAVVVDTGTGGVAAAAEAASTAAGRRLAWLEVPLRGGPLGETARRAALALRDAGAASDVDPVGYVEVPREDGWRAALDVLAEEGLGAKLRTGGSTAAAFPTEGEVAAFVVACVERDLQFKCTAGLHDPLRHTDPATGFEHHGFLNVLLAVDAARGGASEPAVAHVLGHRDATAVAAEVAALGDDRAARVRDTFRSLGTCSVQEPVAALVELGLLVAGGPAA